MTTLKNILVTGTPGTGKTTLCASLADETGLEHLEIGELVKTKGLHSGKDKDFDSYLLDEDKLLDELESMGIENGGYIIDFHSCDFFPERWFSLVVVLRSDNTTLFDRLHNRGYNEKKITENVECEIFGVLLEEARESYNPEIVWERQSVTTEDMENNINEIKDYISSNF